MFHGQEEHPVTQGLDHLVFTWASSLQILSPPESVKAVRLVKTSPDSWIQSGNQLMVDPMREPMPALPIPGMGPAERTLAVALAGKFKSFYAGQDAPAVEGGDTAAPPPEPAKRNDESPDTSILVVGCSMFVSNGNPALSSQNLDFIVSAVEWMAGGEKLSDIRKRKAEARPISEITMAQLILVGFAAPLGAPLGMIVFGVARFAVRRAQKKKFLESVQS